MDSITQANTHVEWVGHAPHYHILVWNRYDTEYYTCVYIVDGSAASVRCWSNVPNVWGFLEVQTNSDLHI